MLQWGWGFHRGVAGTKAWAAAVMLRVSCGRGCGTFAVEFVAVVVVVLSARAAEEVLFPADRIRVEFLMVSVALWDSLGTEQDKKMEEDTKAVVPSNILLSCRCGGCRLILDMEE